MADLVRDDVNYLVRDYLVRVQPLHVNPIEVIIGAEGCPCIHFSRGKGASSRLIDVHIERQGTTLDRMSLTPTEQTRFISGLRQLGLLESTGAVDPVGVKVTG